jgi:hypothetical protein
LTQIIKADNDSLTLIENSKNGNKLVLMFPMTRGIHLNSNRWKKLISTVNDSEVCTLVLIDKTKDYHATDFFIEHRKQINSELVILQRPHNEPTHDSQSLIRLDFGLWILQMHDDDDWTGSINLPDHIDEMTVFRTQFTIVNGSKSTLVQGIGTPDCRAIFSILPSRVWNQFASFIQDQGGHVAGSIDSSLNIVVSKIEPCEIIETFNYIYDNRHWDKRRNANKQLRKITEEDGWGQFATIEMSLVGRTIDGITSLIYFSSFLEKDQVESQLDYWIKSTKPRALRISLKFVQLKIIKLCLILFKVIAGEGFLGKGLGHKHLYHGILLKSWCATTPKDYLEVIDLFLQQDSLMPLHPRFNFWKMQIGSRLGSSS